jgi:hypothetical protein
MPPESSRRIRSDRKKDEMSVPSSSSRRRRLLHGLDVSHASGISPVLSTAPYATSVAIVAASSTLRGGIAIVTTEIIRGDVC